jgi:hypothetical protein
MSETGFKIKSKERQNKVFCREEKREKGQGFTKYYFSTTFSEQDYKQKRQIFVKMSKLFLKCQNCSPDPSRS